MKHNQPKILVKITLSYPEAKQNCKDDQTSILTPIQNQLSNHSI